MDNIGNVTSNHPSFCSVKNGYILPEFKDDWILQGGVCNNEKQFLQNSITKYNAGKDFLPVEYIEHLDNSPKIHETVIYGGYLFKHYGHFLIEGTTRLWFYILHNQNNRRIAFSVNDKNLPQFMKDFFRLLGITDDMMLLIDKPTQFDNIIIPEMSSFIGGNFYPKEFLLPFNIISTKVKSKKILKCYLSYKDYKSNIYGEDIFEKLFKDNGFLVVNPEKLTLEEQISLYKDCNFFAGCNGTCILNCLWSQAKNLKVLALMRVDTDLSCHRRFFNVKNADYKEAKIYINFLPSTQRFGPYLVGITEDFIDKICYFGLKLKTKLFLPTNNDVKMFLLNWFKIYERKENKQYFQETTTNANLDKYLQLRSQFLNDKYFVLFHMLLYFVIYKVSFGKYRSCFKKKYKKFKDYYAFLH